MKFLCVECDARMAFEQRRVPGDGTLAAVFRCGSCGRSVAMLTNPMETQLVSSLGVEIGGREVPAEPMESTREALREPRLDGPETEAEAGVDPGTGSSDRPPPGSPPDGGPEAGDADDAPAPAGPGAEDGGRVHWSEAAVDRLGRVPSFVRGMVRRIYTDYARERGIREITPDVMDRARSDLGLEGM